MRPMNDFQNPQELTQSVDKPECFLILFNVAKDSNFGFLIRTANAFGAKILVAGRNKVARFGATARTRRNPLQKFRFFEEAVDFVRERNCEILGVEIGEEAHSVWNEPFKGPTAFIIGNEGEGLSPKQLEIADRLVYIPQFGTAVSLNINVATGIVLSQFARWAGYEQTPIEGRKYMSTNSNAKEHAIRTGNLES